MKWHGNSRALVKRGVIGSLVGLGAAQVSVAGTIMAIDTVRKRRSAAHVPFPTSEPLDATVSDNVLTVYTYGEDLYRDMLEAIDAAQDTVFFESYIWKGDDVGERFKRSLIAAAERGVKVYVIYDGFANLVVKQSFYDLPDTVRVLRFPAFRPGMLGLYLRRSGRDHRKILVVDHKIGFAGGFNVGDLYATRWRDTHLRVVGPATWELADAFTDFWNRHSGKKNEPLPDTGARSWDLTVRSHRNLPSQMSFPVRGLYLDAINRAQHHVYITQGYFIPDNDIMNALLAARRRGVDVRVIVPEVSNHVLADWAARGFYRDLLEAGVTLWLYQGAMIHAKTCTVDGQWTTIGSANIDRLSLIGNYELNLEVLSKALASDMETVFDMDLGRCRELTLEEWDERGVIAQFSERVIGTLRPLF